MNTTYRHVNHAKLGDVLDGIKLTRVHYIALFLIVSGGLFEVMEQLILSSLGPSLQVAFGISAQAVALLSMATLLSIAVGGVTGGFLADRVGRRSVLAVSVGIYSVGSVIAAFSLNYEMLTAARIITGFGVGGEIAVGLTYLSEITPTRIRGLFVSLFDTIAAGVGIFIAYAYALVILGPFAAMISAGDEAWRWAFGLLGLPAVLVLFMRRYLPETPRFLMEKHRTADLNESLAKLEQGRLRLGKDEARREYFTAEEIDAAKDETQVQSRPDLAELFAHGRWRRTVGLSTMAFLAWGSQFSIFLVMPLLLVERGYSIGSSLTFTMVQNFGGLLGAIVASIGAYKFPRKRMVVIGSVLGIVSIILFPWLATTPLTIMLLGFSFNFSMMMVAVTIWTWAPELFPTKIRGLGTSVVVNVGFVGGALIPLISAWLFETSSQYVTFGIIAVLFAGIIVVSPVVTETHNRSFEEIDAAI